MHELDYTLHGCYVFSFHIQKSVLQKKEAVAFCEKGVLINFAKFTGKHLCQSLFFNSRLQLY